MKKVKPTQTDVIKRMLETDALVTPITVFKETGRLCESSCMRLAARIKNLRDLGHKINTRTVITKGKQVAFYELSTLKKKTVKKS